MLKEDLKMKLKRHPSNFNLDVVKKVVINNAEIFASFIVLCMVESLEEVSKQKQSKPQVKKPS